MIVIESEVFMKNNITLRTKRIALLSTDGFEDSELTRPMEAVEQAGAVVVVVTLDGDNIIGKNGTDVPSDASVTNVHVDEFDGLILPGGVGNPDKLRMNAEAVHFVREFFDNDKPVAAICHAPWMLVEAGVLHDRVVTSYPSLQTDIRNAGGTWVDKPVVVDEKLVTSRRPDDLEQFCAAALEVFNAG